MLQALRERSSSWIIKILLGLVIIAFAIWGINDIFLGERDPAVATVGDVKIARSEAEEALREEMNRLRPVLGDRFDRNAAFRMGLANQVLAQLINQTAINVGTRDLGVVISDQMVSRTIRNNRNFYNARGAFDRNLFYRALANANVSEEYYVHSLKQQLAGNHLRQAIASNIPIPTGLLTPIVRFRSEERTARTVLVPAPSLAEAPEPSASELAAYYEANRERFMAPEYRDVTFVHLDPTVIAEEIRVPEQQIENTYRDRIDTFTLRDRRKVSQVVFRTEDAAKATAAAAASGKDLAEAVREAGTELKVVNLGWVERKDLFAELAEPVFALEKGEISPPIKTSLGWHLVQVEDTEEGRVKPLSEVRDQIRNDLAEREALDGIFSLANQLEDSLAAGETIQAAAAKINVPARRIEALDARGQDRSGKTVPDLPKGGDFLRVAFDTEEGETSQLNETEAGGFYLLTVNKVVPPEAKPLERVRAEVMDAWKGDRQAEAAEARAKEILERLKAGERLEDIAKKENLEIETSQPFTRLTHEAESKIPAALAEQLFSIKVGEAAMAETADGFVVGVLASAGAAESSEKAAVEESTREEIRDGITGDLFNQLVDAFRKRVTIETYPGRLRDRS